MPIFFLLISYIALEIYVVAQVWERFGFINTVFALFIGAIFGVGVVRNQGRFVVQKMQAAMARGLTPEDSILHSVLILIAGILFAVPGFVSDFIGLLFLLPGTRHLFVAIFKRKFKQKVSGGGFSSNFRVFTFGNMGGNMGASQPPPQRPTAQRPVDQWERDVTPRVIDVTPISNSDDDSGK